VNYLSDIYFHYLNADKHNLELFKIIIVDFLHDLYLLKLPLKNWFYFCLEVKRIEHKTYSAGSLDRTTFKPWFSSSSTKGPDSVGYPSYCVHLKAEREPISKTKYSSFILTGHFSNFNILSPCQHYQLWKFICKNKPQSLTL
jgi:hypothetical protein